jgi:tripartite-type tricarboxylate transporter receptor subunit TctC
MNDLAIHRRTVLGALAAATLAPAAGYGQQFPGKPVRLITSFPAGSGPDAMLRFLGERLARTWGQSVVVENRPGGGGFIAVAEARKAAPDGHTLLHIDGLNFTAAPHLYKTLPYDPVNDFRPITPLHAGYFFIAVASASPWRTVADLLAAARSQPGQVTYGSWQVGSIAHLGAAALESASGSRMNHIPFKETSQLYAAVAGGDVNWAFGSPASAGPLQRAGKLRFLALAAPQRLTTHPDVPTVAESGGPAGFETTSWVGLFGLPGLPVAVAARISQDVTLLMADPEVRSKLVDFGYVSQPLTPEQTVAKIEQERVRYARTIRDAGIRLE